MRQIDKIIVHCSATPNDREVTVEDIDRWHKERGWYGCGYHIVIYRNGSIHMGRPLSKIGAHCKGRNTGSIGVCLIGNDEFTSAQFESLRSLNSLFKSIFTGMKIYGHRDFTDLKSCPNFSVQDIIKGD